MRGYGQFCPIARASEILAERWTPIVMRNVLQGARTFNQIAAGAPGISRPLLTRRLHELQHAGLLDVAPKPDGHGSIYSPTDRGQALGPVLDTLGDWAEEWVDVRPEHATNADPGRVIGSWSHNFLALDRLPDHRVVVRFDYTRRGRPDRSWLVLDGSRSEACAFDPGFGDDLTVTIDEPLAFAKWHLGLLGWEAALRTGVTVRGPETLRRALPTWNSAPAFYSRHVAEDAQVTR